MRPTIYKRPMEKVLYIRVPMKMSKALHRLARQKRKERPGKSISIADMVREIIHDFLKKVGEEEI